MDTLSIPTNNGQRLLGRNSSHGYLVGISLGSFVRAQSGAVLLAGSLTLDHSERHNEQLLQLVEDMSARSSSTAEDFELMAGVLPRSDVVLWQTRAHQKAQTLPWEPQADALRLPGQPCEGGGCECMGTTCNVFVSSSRVQ